MIFPSQKRWNYYLIALVFPVFLWSQLYHSYGVDDLASRYFGLEYFPASWQASVFADDAYASLDEKKQNQFNLLSNALRLNYSAAEKMLMQFKSEYPNAKESATIDYDVANYYFNNEKYRYALKWFSRVTESQIPKLEVPVYNFNKGYTLFSAKRYEQAKPYLEKVKNAKDYESDAHYYLGHIAYQLDDYDTAVSEFNDITDPDQKENLNYFQADMNFRLGRFQQAIPLAKKVLEDPSTEVVSEASKIIGESHFNLGEYAAAIPYLEAYKGKKGKWDNTDFYQLGFAYYNTQSYEKALAQFNKIISANNALAQNAYYYLADCYMRLNNKAAAQNAFKKASEMNFDSEVAEDSFFNYAKLSYEIGNPYETPPQVLISFLDAYPKHEQAKLIGELLVSSYTKEGNYLEAIKILDGKSGYKDKATLEQVVLLQAIVEFNNARYNESSNLFMRVLKINENDFLEAYALYWLGRSEYERNLFDRALEHFKAFKKHPHRAWVESHNRLEYDIGYVYFKLGEYAFALEAFEAFDSKNNSFDTGFQRDTFLRMGDCSFAMRKYWPAMEHYTKALALNEAAGAYPSFQKAMSYGFVDRNPKKIETLLTLQRQYPKDPLLDDTLFELASAYSREGDSENAIATYDSLLKKFTNSPYLAQAALNKGLILYNTERYEQAQSVLEEVATQYKRYAVAEQAVRTLRELAVDQGKVGEFSQWIRSQGLTTFTDTELEKIAFEAAEKRFLEGNVKAAERLLTEYLNDYPQGVYVLTATYYLAELYFETQDLAKAQVAYEELAQGSVTNYTEKALVRLISLFKSEAEVRQSIPYLEKLDSIASFQENKRFALLNLMQAYYAEEAYLKTLLLTERVLNLPELESKLQWDALTLKAKSAVAIQDTLTAAETYKKLETAPESNIVAEALYFRAYQLYVDKKYESSNELIGKIAQLGSASGIWNVKALVLLAKNYYSLEDSFQAVFVLESVIENFSAYPEQIEEAQKLLERYTLDEKTPTDAN
jgi:tetratricopeptide (TPR) repeat protein